MYLLKILTLFSLVLLPFGEILRVDIGNNVVIKPLDIVMGLLAISWLCIHLAKRQMPKIPQYFLVFPIVGFVSLLINLSWLQPTEFFIALLYGIRWVAYASIVFVVAEFNKSFQKKIKTFLFIDGLLLVLLGYLQYFFYNSLKNLYYVGWDEHMHRIFSTFLDPNFSGAFFVLFFFFTAAELFSSLQNKNKKHSIFLSIVLAITLLAIFLTFSRAALLMLLAGSIIFFILIKRKIVIFVLILLIVLFGIILSPKFNDENMNLFRTSSSMARISNYETALQIIQKNPLFGVGFDSYRYAKARYGFDMGWVDAPSHADAGVDNSFLFVFATTGIMGLAAYLWLWISILKDAYVLHKKHVQAIIVFSSIIALFVNAMFINSLFFPALMLWLWLMIGLMKKSVTDPSSL